jgi:uroporphyrinogen decarboxylase
MRQAGRYLPEYREVRERHDFLEVCRTPELATRVTLQPIERFGLDAAILFSDILVPAEALGVDVRFEPGPVIDAPIRTAADVERLHAVDFEERLGYVFDAVRMIRRELAGRAPLIGFAAAPLTLAVYLVEGGGSKSYDSFKSLLYGDPATARRLMEVLADATARYLRAQIEAGAQAIQLFDTWAGLLRPDVYREFDLPFVQTVMQRLEGLGVPRIYFALDGAHLFDEIRGCGADVLGVDWRTPLDVADARLGHAFALQGNLDPGVLLATPAAVRDAARRILESGRGLRGHVFNLGHGISPTTPVENVAALVELVQGWTPGY